MMAGFVPFRPTDKRPGDLIVASGKAYRVRTDSDWEPLEAANDRAVQPRIRWWTPLVGDPRRTAAGILVAASFIITLLGLLCIGA